MKYKFNSIMKKLGNGSALGKSPVYPSKDAGSQVSSSAAYREPAS